MKHRTGHMFQRSKNGNWYLQWRINGKTFSKSLGTAVEKDAAKERDRILDGVRVSDDVASLTSVRAKLEAANLRQAEICQKDAMTIKNAFLAYKNAGNLRPIAKSTMQIYELYWSRFEKWIETKHPELKQLREVNFQTVEEYFNLMRSPDAKGRQVTGRTLNAHRNFFRAMWNILQEKAQLDGNPWAQLATQDEDVKGRENLTSDELIRICRKATGELRVMIALGLYLGARLGDCALMDWGSIDLMEKRIRYTPNKTAKKTGERLEIFIHPTLHAVLSEIPQGDRQGYVLPNMAELYVKKGPYAVSALVQKHFKECGLTTTENGLGIRRRVVRGFHSLRHTTVSLLRGGNVPQITSMGIVGHRTKEIHHAYSHGDLDAQARAIQGLPDVLGNSLTTQTDPFKIKIKELAERINAETWKTVQTQILDLVR